MSDHTFCRLLLRETMKEVRKHTTVEERKKAWAWKGSSFNDTVEFHGPNNFYWVGSGHCLWEAKAGGWAAWLDANTQDEDND